MRISFPYALFGTCSPLARGLLGTNEWHSQYGQDRFIIDNFFAAEVVNAATPGLGARKGVFVELGAADGLDKSNTLAFERQLGWTGVLIEPSDELFLKLKRNRPNSICVHACVARRAGTYDFTDDGLSSGFTDLRGPASIGHGTARKCQTLPEILDEHLGPSASIDYLSLDMEGGELEILQTFDFSRRKVDIISIEVHDWRDPLRSSRIRSLLERRNFHFVEKIVWDEIFVRRRGFDPDPGCMHPSVTLAVVQDSGPPSGWAHVRTLLYDFWNNLTSDEARWARPSLLMREPELAGLLQAQDSGDAEHWDNQCPLGVLTLVLATVLLRNRAKGLPMDSSGIAEELQGQTLPHSTEQLKRFADYYANGFYEAVVLSERLGERFEMKFPLGRTWHEARFTDIITSGWPIFGYLDIMGRLVNQSGHMYRTVGMDGTDYRFPLPTPRLLCRLQPHSRGSKTRLEVLQKVRERTYVASSDLGFDTDACGLLGVAAARFHAVRAEVREYFRKGSADIYIPLANWTSTCDRLSSGVDRASCSAQTREQCSGMDNRMRFLPSQCLRLRGVPINSGVSVTLRRSAALFETRAAYWLMEGERMLRLFVQRHGLYSMIWASARPELSPVRFHGRRESLFAVLQSLQEEFLEFEGLLGRMQA